MNLFRIEIDEVEIPLACCETNIAGSSLLEIFMLRNNLIQA